MARSHHRSAVADVSLPATLADFFPSQKCFLLLSFVLGRRTACHRLTRPARVAINRVCSDFGLLKLQNTVGLFHWPVQFVRQKLSVPIFDFGLEDILTRSLVTLLRRRSNVSVSWANQYSASRFHLANLQSSSKRTTSLQYDNC